MRSKGGGRARRLGAAAAVVSLAAAVPVVAGGTAQANPRMGLVVVTGTASCERFPFPHRSSVTEVTITPRFRAPKTDELSGQRRVERYALAFTNVPRLPRGLPATAEVTCADRHGHEFTYSKRFVIQRPEGRTVTQILNLF
ncbi:hypothetical protein [Streptomyces sp. NPDC047000]|uniref:hypothetical protein n=1 Tax=Streptomyces sp. NPDC047000 TaxID=3155474 RepID=UPI0033D4828C